MPNLKGTENMSRIFAYVGTNGAKESLLPSENEQFCVAAHGDIENRRALLSLCGKSGYESEEALLLGCLCAMDEKNKTELLFRLSDAVVGNISFAFIPSGENAIYCKSGISKLFVGISENGAYLSSELDALLPLCEKYTVLENSQSAKLTKDRAVFFDSKHRKIKKAFNQPDKKRADISAFQIVDGALSCSLAARETFFRFVKNGKLSFDYLKLKSGYLNKINKIVLLGSASSKNTALACRALFETYCLIDATAQSCDEFMLSKAPVDKNTLVIILSESSEIQALEALRKARENGAKNIAVSGSRHSSLALDCDYLISPNKYSDALSVSERFVSDYLALSLFSLWFGSRINVISDLFLGVSAKMAEMLSGIIQTATKASPAYEKAAELLASKTVAVCSEGGEFSFSGAEIIRKTAQKSALPLTLDELCETEEEQLFDFAVFALITDKERIWRTAKKLGKIKQGGAEIVIIASESISQELEGFENVISFNDSLPLFNPLPCISSLYKIALMAQERASDREVEQSA